MMCFHHPEPRYCLYRKSPLIALLGWTCDGTFKLFKMSIDWKGVHDGGSTLLVNLHGFC